MSRSGYLEGCDNDWSQIMYRGAVASASRGKRGQALFKDLLAALDAMPVKELIAAELEQEGSVCALGALGRVRGIELSKIDPEDQEKVGEVFGIAESLAREIVWENDEGGHYDEVPSKRWARMRRWVESQIKTPTVEVP